MTHKENIEFLRAYFKKLQDIYEATDYLCIEDFAPVPDDYIPATSPEAERVARLADDNGFDGNLFRNLTKNNENPLSQHSIRHLYKQIETIPRIIAKIDNPSDRSAIPDNAALITIPQLAGILQCGESVVRERDKKGLLPTPIRIGGTIQWSRKEIESWIEAGCPARQKWEQRKVVS